MPTATAPDGGSSQPELSRAALRLDAEGLVIELDPQWDRRLDLYGVTVFRRREVLGRTLEALLDGPSAAAWRRQLDDLLRGRSGPPAFTGDLLGPWRPWPDGDGGTWLSLDDTASARWLRLPLLRLDDGRAVACSGAARRLLEARPELAEPRRLEAFLATRFSPLRLVPVPGLRHGGRPLFTCARPPLYDIEAFDFLCRLVRAALHDLSNPLAAMRMMVEVSAHGGELFDDGVPAMHHMEGHLEAAIRTVYDLRALIHADGAASDVDVAAEMARVAGLLRSELSRRDVDLDTEAPAGASLLAGPSAFRLLLTAGLLSSCDRARSGSRLRLAWRVGDGETSLVCAIDGGPGALAHGHANVDLLRRLAATCDGHLAVAPGERPDGDPDWRIELGEL